MSKTARLKLPLIHSGQAQKEITHNEALTILDALINSVVQEIGTNLPPGDAKVGELYIIGKNPEDKFVKHPNEIAARLEHGWQYIKPPKWLEVTLDNDGSRYRFDGEAWITSNTTASIVSMGQIPQLEIQNTYLIKQNSGEYLKVEHLQEEVTLQGAHIDATIKIPHHSVVIAVSVRVIEAITGTNSFSVGAEGDKVRYGNNIGIGKDTTNTGLTEHLRSYWQNTPITLTANNGSFTGGKIKVTVQLLKPHGPWNWD